MYYQCVVPVDIAMSGQHPFKFITQKLLHRARLFGPRVPAGSADRAGGTRNECHHRELCFRIGFGLMMNAALIAVIAKDFRGQLATRIAVDAG